MSEKESYVKAQMLKLREASKVLGDLNFCGNINCRDCLMCYTTENDRRNCLLVFLKNLTYTASSENIKKEEREIKKEEREILENTESPLKVDIVEK